MALPGSMPRQAERRFSAPPQQVFPPDLATHMQYVRTLDAYLERVSMHPQSFLMKVEMRRQACFGNLLDLQIERAVPLHKMRSRMNEAEDGVRIAL